MLIKIKWDTIQILGNFSMAQWLEVGCNETILTNCMPSNSLEGMF